MLKKIQLQLLCLPLTSFPKFYLSDNTTPKFVQSKYGTLQLTYDQHVFNRHVRRESITYWRCSQFAVLRCRARIKTCFGKMTLLNVEHNHPIITETRKYGSLKEIKRRQMEELMLKEEYLVVELTNRHDTE